MIADFKAVMILFEEIADALKTKASVFVIGGAVMLYRGLKGATKDVDIVVETLAEFSSVERAIKSAGFKTKFPSAEYKKNGLKPDICSGRIQD